MKSLLLSFLTIALLVSVHPLPAAPTRPVVEALEQLAARAGRVPAKGAAEALEAAFRAHGDRALQAAHQGGIELAEAAARHGNDVFAMAVRVPQAAAAIATRADVLLPLARRHGDDFLRLEAKVPGLAEDAFRVFTDKKDIARLLKLPAEEARQVLIYAAHATDPAAARHLLKAVETKGPGFLAKLDNAKILATGLSVSMIIAAAGVSLTAGEAVAETAGNVLQIPIILLTLLLCGYILFLLWKSWPFLRNLRVFRSEQTHASTSPSPNSESPSKAKDGQS